MNAIEGSGQIVPEPDWESVFSDALDVAQAKEHWRVLTTELKDRTLLSMANAHGLLRLVMAYVIYDKSMNEVAEHGAVTKPKRGSRAAIARVSPHISIMREMAADAGELEAEFGLSPRRRAAATKSEVVKKTSRAADAYLKPVAKG